MAPFLVTNPLFPMYEMEARNSNRIPRPKAAAAEVLPMPLSQSSRRESSSGERSGGDTEGRANRRTHQSSHSARLTRRRTTEENIGNARRRIVAESNTHEGLTMVRRISALAKTPMTEWQGWRNRRAEKIQNKSQETKTSVSSLQNDCTCPGAICLPREAARMDLEAREAQEAAKEAAEEAAIAAAKQIEKRDRDSSKRKGKGKGKEDLNDECFSPRQNPKNVEDEEKTTITRPRIIAWYPESQYKPPPSCNRLLLSLDHGFSDGQIQKMRWFLNRMQRGLAIPDDWVEDETQVAGQREAHKWNFLHPLEPGGLIPPSLSFFNRNWISVRLATVQTKPSCSPQNPQRSNSPIEPPHQPNLSFANLAPVTIEEYIAASISASQPRFNRPNLQIDTSIHGDNPPGNTPNNTPQTAASHSASALSSEDASETSMVLNMANLNLGVVKMQDNLPPENGSINSAEIGEIHA